MKKTRTKAGNMFSHHRAIIYTLSLTGGLIILLTFRDVGMSWYTYWILAALIYSFMITEVLSTYTYAHKKAKIIELPHIPDNTLRPNFYYHTILPTLLYFATVTNIFIDLNATLDLVLIILISGTYYVFLRHIRAAYEQNFKTEEWSHQILDSANVIIYFSTATAIAELAARFDWPVNLVTVLTALFLLTFLLLTLWKRMEMSIVGVISALLLSIIMAGMTYFSWTYLGLASYSIRMGFLWSLGYYLLSTMFIHKQEGSLKFGVLVEYVLIAVVAVFLLSQG